MLGWGAGRMSLPLHVREHGVSGATRPRALFLHDPEERREAASGRRFRDCRLERAMEGCGVGSSGGRLGSV
jgi:hypothetical protein